MSEQPSPQETQRNRRVNDQGQQYPPQQPQPTRPAPPQNPQGHYQQAPRYPQGQQGRPAQRPQGHYRQPPQNPQGAYQQAPQQPRYPQQGQRPQNPYPPQGQVPYQQAPQRPMPAPPAQSSSSTNDIGAVLGQIGKFVAGFFKVLAYPFVKLAQLIGRVLTIILEEMVRTVVSFVMGLVLFAMIVAIIAGYGFALANVDFNFVEAVPEMFRLFGELVGLE